MKTLSSKLTNYHLYLQHIIGLKKKWFWYPLSMNKKKMTQITFGQLISLALSMKELTPMVSLQRINGKFCKEQCSFSIILLKTLAPHLDCMNNFYHNGHPQPQVNFQCLNLQLAILTVIFSPIWHGHSMHVKWLVYWHQPICFCWTCPYWIAVKIKDKNKSTLTYDLNWIQGWIKIPISEMLFKLWPLAEEFTSL